MNRTAILLIAHGSRRPEANDDLHFVAEQLQRRGLGDLVVASFLELAEPTIEAGGALCAARGAARVVMLPYFLSAGIHVQHDLATIRDRLRAQYPGVDFQLCQPIGRHPKMIQILEERLREVEPLDPDAAGPLGTGFATGSDE